MLGAASFAGHGHAPPGLPPEADARPGRPRPAAKRPRTDAGRAAAWAAPWAPAPATAQAAWGARPARAEEARNRPVEPVEPAAGWPKPTDEALPAELLRDLKVNSLKELQVPHTAPAW